MFGITLAAGIAILIFWPDWTIETFGNVQPKT
jgi:hypothetical protein